LLIGVSFYDCLDLGTLDNSFKSVFIFYTFFNKNKQALQIATIRILLQPTKKGKKDKDLAAFCAQYPENLMKPTGANCKKELEKLYTQPTTLDSSSVFYFAGHGNSVGHPTQQMVLCQD
jgi:Caspase domain